MKQVHSVHSFMHRNHWFLAHGNKVSVVLNTNTEDTK